MKTRDIVDHITVWLKDYAIQSGAGGFVVGVSGGIDLSPIANLTKTEVYALGVELGISSAIMQVPPTDGLWGGDRTDEDQIGASYPELEWAMNLAGDEAALGNREREVLAVYSRPHAASKHKVEAIPLCVIPQALKQN